MISGTEYESMGKVTLEIPDSLLEALRVPPDESEARLRQELAVRLYEKGLLSLGKARELAQMGKWDFHELLAQEQIVLLTCPSERPVISRNAPGHRPINCEDKEELRPWKSSPRSWRRCRTS
jgi:predicted HTH domain antitoxin